jgi:peroxiredoxin
MKKKVKYSVMVAAILLLASAFTHCNYDTKTPSGTMDAARVGTVAPDFILKDLDGNKVRLSDYRENVVLLNFWASWCPPCRAEMPSMESLKAKMEGEEFIILAVSVDASSPNNVKNFVQKNGYTFDILHDPDQAVAKAYLVSGIPTSYIIDTDGVIVERAVGAELWDASDRIELFRSLLK